jgi:WD40 repeat protein
MYLAVGTGNGEISIWDATKTDPVCRLHTSEDNRILDIAWNDVGNLVFVSGSNGVVYFMALEVASKPLTGKAFLSIVMKVIV